MTVNELISKLQELDAGEQEICVHAFGGMPSTAWKIKGVTLGFDWESGKVVIHTERQLTVYVSPAEQKEQKKRHKEFLTDLQKRKPK